MKTLLYALFASFFFTQTVYAATLPAAFTAIYNIKKGPIKLGEAVRQLKKTGSDWQYTSTSRTTGFFGAIVPTVIIQTSHFDWTNGMIRLRSYDFTKNKTAKVVHQVYNWDKKQVISQDGDKRHVYAIPDKVQDQSIYQLSLMLDIADGKRNFVYHVAENVRLKDYHIKYVGHDSIESNINGTRGRIDTVKVSISTKDNKTTIWFSPAHFFIPAQIEFEEGGTSFMAYLKKLSTP